MMFLFIINNVIFNLNVISYSRLIVFNFSWWINPPSIYILNLGWFIPKINKSLCFRLAIGWQADTGPTSALGVFKFFQHWPVGIRLVIRCWLSGDGLACQRWSNVGKLPPTLATIANVGPTSDCYLGWDFAIWRSWTRLAMEFLLFSMSERTHSWTNSY